MHISLGGVSLASRVTIPAIMISGTAGDVLKTLLRNVTSTPVGQMAAHDHCEDKQNLHALEESYESSLTGTNDDSSKNSKKKEPIYEGGYFTFKFPKGDSKQCDYLDAIFGRGNYILVQCV